MKIDSRLVYSTEKGKICPGCEQPEKQCICKQNRHNVTGDGIVRISRQTKGRKGSGVSIITGIPLTDNELKKIAKLLKKKCGSGGTLKQGIIEIQGDHRQVLKNELTRLGYQVKLAGG